MKRKFIALAVLGLSAGVYFSSCNNNQPDKKIENAQEDLHESEQKAEKDRLEAESKAEKDKLEAENKYEEEWLKFKNEQEERLQANDAEIKRYRANADKVKKADRNTYEVKVKDLEDRNANLRARIDAYDKDTDRAKKNSGWENFKREFNHDMDELGNAFKDLGKNNVHDKNEHK
jgi:Tfp pilus assembly protein PilE